MPGTPTAKYGIPTIDDEDFVSQYPAAYNAGVTTIDQLMAAAISGVRPAAGKYGRFHRDADSGVISFDTGTAWVELVLASAVEAVSFVGMTVFDAGDGDVVATDQEWMRPDGRLIDRTVYSAYYARVGHKHNAGVDPGGNQVRLADYRGRTLVGADNMGTSRGAAGRIPNSPRAAGQSGGEEQHRLTTGEMPAHTHGQNAGGSSVMVPSGSFYGVATDEASTTGSAGGDQPHNNMQPYSVDNLLVRVR
jgi:microcystin-dependent protein